MSDNEYLTRRNQPTNEKDFYEKYGITLTQGRTALQVLYSRYKHINPEMNLSYETSFRERDLTRIFVGAGENFEKFLENAYLCDCRLVPFDLWIRNIYRKTLPIGAEKELPFEIQ